MAYMLISEIIDFDLKFARQILLALNIAGGIIIAGMKKIIFSGAMKLDKKAPDTPIKYMTISQNILSFIDSFIALA